MTTTMVKVRDAEIGIGKVRFEHYRVPNFITTSRAGNFRKGEPLQEWLQRWKAMCGFVGRPNDVSRETRRWQPCPRGGMTVCKIEFAGTTIAGVAMCSMSDVFSYRVGRKIAMERALYACYKKLYPDF